MNDLQQLALVSVIRQREEKEFERDWRSFVMTALAMHPENAENILKLLDREAMEKEAREGLAEPLTEEEMEEYVPLQLRPERRDILKDLQSYGVALVEDQD